MTSTDTDPPASAVGRFKNTINAYNTTPEQRYLIHRARSARWEAERNRQQIPNRISLWRLLADGAAITLCAMVVAVAVAVMVSQMRV